MVLRSIVGALATVAVLGAVAAALPDRSSSKPANAAQPPFGQLAKPGFQTAAPAIASADQNLAKQGLMKLASYTTPQSAAPLSRAPASVAQSESVVAAVDRVASGPAVMLAFAPTPTESTASFTTARAPEPPPAKDGDRPASRTVVAAIPPASPSPTARSSGQLNINKAPVEALDHLPGGGRIGLSIVRRRPYASIDDLVRKRVLRKSAFARIRSAITVD